MLTFCSSNLKPALCLCQRAWKLIKNYSYIRMQELKADYVCSQEFLNADLSRQNHFDLDSIIVEFLVFMGKLIISSQFFSLRVVYLHLVRGVKVSFWIQTHNVLSQHIRPQCSPLSTYRICVFINIVRRSQYARNLDLHSKITFEKLNVFQVI